MSESAESGQTPSGGAPPPINLLQVSAYDRVASLLVALLLLVSLGVGILVLMVFTMRIVTSRQIVPLELVEEVEPAATGLASGGGEDFLEPGVEEIEPSTPPQLADMLAAVTDAVTAQPAAVENMTGQADRAGHGRRAGPGGSGTGAGPDVIPFGRRTKIHYGEISLDAYARLLDHFRIELAVAGGGKPTVDYASQLSQPVPLKRSDAPESEHRVYLIWRPGSRLEEFDRSLLARAGVDAQGRHVMQFLPPEVVQTLRALEKEHAGSRDESQLRMTVYRIVQQDGGYAFEVLQQQYR